MLGRAAEYIFGADTGGYALGSEIFVDDIPGFADGYVGWAAEIGITSVGEERLFDAAGQLEIRQTGVFANRAFEYFYGLR